MGQRAGRAILHDTEAVTKFLELRRCGSTLASSEVGLAASVNRVNVGIVELNEGLGEIVWCKTSSHLGQFWAALVRMEDRRGVFPMKNRFTVSRTGETDVFRLKAT
jgi:hypothetical protein